MNDIESNYFTKILIIFPLVAIIILIISFFTPAVNIRIIIGLTPEENLSLKITTWGIVEGNLIELIRYFLGSAVDFLFLLTMLFGVSLTISCIRLAFSIKKLYLKQENFAIEKKKWLKQGIMIIFHGILIIIISNIVFSSILDIIFETSSTFDIGDYVSYDFGTIGIFIAGGIVLAGVIVGILLDREGRLGEGEVDFDYDY